MMEDPLVQVWLLRAAGVLGGIVVVELLRRFWKAQPCWLFNHRMRHLSIEKLVWPNGICHRCNESLQRGQFNEAYRHLPHVKRDGDRTDLKLCYVTKWICDKKGCGEMGAFCVGEEGEGAWTIQHGAVVPDEKEWAKWGFKPKSGAE